MWRAFQTAESVSAASTASAPRPNEARCWFTSVTTCDANDAFDAGQVAPGVHAAVAPSAGGDRSSGAAAATTATAMAAATMTRTLGTRRRCAVSESVKRPLDSDRSSDPVGDSPRKVGAFGGIALERWGELATPVLPVRREGERHE